MGNMQVLLGEFGLVFDMNNRRAFKTGNYSLIFGPSPKIEISACEGKSLRWDYNFEEQLLFVYNEDYSGKAIIKVRLK
jgi:hypothetical protein